METEARKETDRRNRGKDANGIHFNDKISRIDLQKVQELYAQGLNMRRVGEAFGVSAAAIHHLLRRHNIPVRKKGTVGHHWGTEHHNWKAESASYAAFHTRLDRLFGRSPACTCCGTMDESQMYEWANLTGDYANPKDYARMCRLCHRRYDAERWRKTGKRTMPCT